VLAHSNLVKFANENLPQHGRLALTNHAGEMRVMFESASALSRPAVRFGTSADALSTTVTGSCAVPYTIDDMCFPPANDPKVFFSPGHICDVVMTGLAPATQYFYQYGSLDLDLWSEMRSFTSAPVAGPGSTVSLFMYGDMGVSLPFLSRANYSYPPAEATRQLMLSIMKDPSISPFRSPPTMAYHIGDISYGRGYPIVWEWFLTLMEPITASMPYMVRVCVACASRVLMGGG
jgi:hypothetical protein